MKRAALGRGNHDLVDRLTYPWFEKLARYIPARVTPNSITAVGFCMMLVACFGLMAIRSPSGLIVFVVFSLISNALDALDGIHARATGQTSKFGDFLDHFFDQFSALLVSFGLLVRFDLFTPLYVGIVMSLMTINTLAFVYKSTAGYLYIGHVGPTTSLVLVCVAFVLIVVLNDPVLFAFHPEDPVVARALESLGVRTVNLGKLTLLISLPMLPSSFYLFYGLARKHVRETKEA
jgi:archaetidylinositol phosphate synthase